mmetsp:Transcript_10993/g.25756  ORF Transcript_10993/g.25756 Transcript_10993/m.25756 type:complete len:272 (-) Transcript_10993:404-1219(-)
MCVYSHRYRCRYSLPDEAAVLAARRALAALDAEVAPNASGCARSESVAKLVSSDAAKSRRVTRGLHGDEALVSGGVHQGKARAKTASGLGDDVGSRSGLHVKREREGATVNVKEVAEMTKMYRAMRSLPTTKRLVAKRSHVHGWGLFVKLPVRRNDMIVEYMGETVRGVVADLRERQYEEEIGSCYLFRLDRTEIVDATKRGSMARFINHSCAPNAYAKVVGVEGGSKKIVFFALRDLNIGEEVFYDYKFPIEDEKIPCTCGAPNCRRFLN